MKKLIYLLVILVFTSTSCIDWGLEKLPVYDELEITDFDLEFRYTTENANGVKSMVFTTLNSVADISSENATITVDATIPSPNSVFTPEIRKTVSLTNIAAYAKLSPAAKIEPLDDSPVLGVPGDFSGERKYRVTAADGKTTKDWTVKINPLPLISKYEGMYHSTGTYTEPNGTVTIINRDKYLTTVNANTVICDHSIFLNEGEWMDLTVNSDNSVSIRQWDSYGDDWGVPTEGLASTYDPATKTFKLYYKYDWNYENNWNVIVETIVMN